MNSDVAGNTDVAIRVSVAADDLRRIVDLHRDVYGAEYGWSADFAEHVMEGVQEFAQRRDHTRSRVWLVEHGAALAGCIAMVPVSAEDVQLRWFLLDRELRGKGLGWELMRRALEFARECGYRRVFLWTVSELTTAAALYRGAGFTRTEAHPRSMWGRDLVEERYDLTLS